MIWNERGETEPRARMRRQTRDIRPAKRMRPQSGASKPEIWLISVVLPAPFGPMMACNSPGATSSVTIVGHGKPAEAFAQVLEAQDRAQP